MQGCKKIMLFFLLIAPAFVHAQVDTAILSDTLIQEVEAPPPPVQETITETDQYGDDNTKYFLKKPGSNEGDIIELRKVPDSIVKKMRQDKDFWYVNAEIKKEKKPDENEPEYTPLGQQQWVQTLLWLVIIGGFAAAIMWYLAGSHVGLFRRKNKVLQSTGDEELETADIFAINYQKEIDKAEASRNYRLATRLMFLRLLKNMADKNIIQYKQDRTNLDYLFQLQPTGYYNNFFRVTRSYEYSWYGQFEVGENAYSIIKDDFKQFDSLLK